MQPVNAQQIGKDAKKVVKYPFLMNNGAIQHLTAQEIKGALLEWAQQILTQGQDMEVSAFKLNAYEFGRHYVLANRKAISTRRRSGENILASPVVVKIINAFTTRLVIAHKKGLLVDQDGNAKPITVEVIDVQNPEPTKPRLDPKTERVLYGDDHEQREI